MNDALLRKLQDRRAKLVAELGEIDEVISELSYFRNRVEILLADLAESQETVRTLLHEAEGGVG